MDLRKRWCCQTGLNCSDAVSAHRKIKSFSSRSPWLCISARITCEDDLEEVHLASLDQTVRRSLVRYAPHSGSRWLADASPCKPTSNRRMSHVSFGAISCRSITSSRSYSGNPAFRRPSISSFEFDCPPRAMYSDIVKAGSTSSRRAVASRASASRPRWAKADARQR